MERKRRKGNKKRLYETDFTFESGYDLDDILNMSWEQLGSEYYDADWDPDHILNNTTIENITGTEFNTVKVEPHPIFNNTAQNNQTINVEPNINNNNTNSQNEQKPEPKHEPEQKPEPEKKPEPEQKPEPGPKPNPNPEPKPDPEPEQKTTPPDPDPIPETDDTKKVTPDLDKPKVEDKTKGTIFDTTETKEAMEDTVKYVKETADDAKNAVKEFMDGKLMRTANVALNAAFAIGDYKDFRRKGDGVVTASLKAAGKFAIDEALGFYALPIELIKSAPSLAIQGAEMLYKENRKMNSAANQQVFGGSQFADSQQLATMRQSGMEMAKMAQYNLQQTLMGTEATYLHR